MFTGLFFWTMTITINNRFIMFGSWNAKEIFTNGFFIYYMQKYIKYPCEACLRAVFTPCCLAHSSLGFWYHPSACGSNGTRAVTADGQGFPGKWVTSEMFWLLRLESQPGKLHARSLPHGWDWWGNCVRFHHHSCLGDVTWMVIWFRKVGCKRNKQFAHCYSGASLFKYYFYY